MPDYLKLIKNEEYVKYTGSVTSVIGLVIEASGPKSSIGEECYIRISKGARVIRAEVVGFKEGKVLLMPIGDMEGIEPGCEVVATGHCVRVKVGPSLLGRILDGLGNPMDDKGPLLEDEYYPIMNNPPPPLTRRRITENLSVGIKAIDGLLTIGKGQRMGIFSGSGVGKSTLLGMIARNTSADINVIGLVGERGREVKDFIERDLTIEGLKRSVVIVATSDQPPLVRLRGAFVATAVAEYFRDRGRDVMFMMDSITRFARAQREVGLATGEPPVTRGYPASVFALLPRILERTGTSDAGTITGLYTVLVDADDMNEPIADGVRAVLDGHIVLSREIAARNHYPAIDIMHSVSRLMLDIVPRRHNECAKKLREVLATYNDSTDLINIGAYTKGSNKKIDYAISMIDGVNEYLRQDVFDRITYSDTVENLLSLFGEAS